MNYSDIIIPICHASCFIYFAHFLWGIIFHETKCVCFTHPFEKNNILFSKALKKTTQRIKLKTTTVPEEK